jgi:hypothetical protein
MSSKQFAIYSGSTSDSIAPKKYFPWETIENLFCFTETYEEATEKFEEITLENKPIWIQIVCLNTYNIIKSYKCFDIHLPLIQTWYDDEADYDDYYSNNEDEKDETNNSIKNEKMDSR